MDEQERTRLVDHILICDYWALLMAGAVGSEKSLVLWNQLPKDTSLRLVS